jgi:hypothetical protein
MCGNRSAPWAAVAWSVLMCGVYWPATADAQAWMAPEGTGSVTFTYQIIDNTGHRLTDGSLLPDGKSTDVSLFIETDYSVTERLSISVGLPYVFAKYRGPGHTPAWLPVDQCKCWHSGFQDFGATVRYSWTRGGFALTPSVAAGVPSHAYDYHGEAVVGRRLKELRLAIDAGQRLDALSPRLFVEERYSYAFVERVLDIRNNRSNLAIEPGVLVTRKVSLRGILAWQHTHGGLRFGSFPPSDFEVPGDVNTPERFDQHDRLLRDNNWRVGGAATYSLRHIDIFGSYIEYVSGTDTHAGRGFSVGLSWPFEVGGATR